jgi:prepilin-type N-terminal cleavage/methylation domain-containing protein
MANRTDNRPAKNAFTLVELMVSIALVVLLIVGINAVFKYTTDAVGTGQAFSAGIRDSRALQAVFTNDLATYVANGNGPSDAPFIVITSTSVPIFRDRADEAGDQGVGAAPNGTPRQLTIDLNGDGVEGDPNVPGEIISPIIYNNRNHRTDTLSFFGRGLFHRQTGNDGTYVADMSSQEAYIWYGHLWLPDNSNPPQWTTATLPGSPTGTNSAGLNPNNYYSSQLVLGRVAMLLGGLPDAAGNLYRIPPQPPPPQPPVIFGVDPQKFIQRSLAKPLSPLGQKKWDDTTTGPANQSSSSDGWRLHDSRYDLAGTTISVMQQDLLGQQINFWAASSTSVTGDPTAPWWQYFTSNFRCEPFLIRSVNASTGQVGLISSANVGQAHPYLVKGCSQFIVEFAGDFMTQNNDPTDYTPGVNGTASDGTYGDVQQSFTIQHFPSPGATATTNYAVPASDGVIDFVVDKTQDTSPGKTNPALWQRKIRWYGLPRDENGDGIVQGWRAGLSNNDLLDVVPVRDVARTAINNSVSPVGFTGFPWEHFALLSSPVGTDSFRPVAGTGNYADVNVGISPKNGFVKPPTYTVAMGPYDPRIKMIRITLTVTDSGNRIADGQTFQYVYQLP